ncbi:MAG TPA: hypothetical protein VGO00_28760, partial [Kofleriaceae bacterium]|nr:hypothetical protein [Kofleriaceae bacterium]
FKADPRDVETLGLLAQAFQALDQKAKTVSVLKELARVHLENKHRDKAADVFRKILEFVPNDPDAIAALGAQPPALSRPPAVPPRTPDPPLPRAQTPMPAPIRAATGEAKFNITTDLPALTSPASTRMTGSMPLVDEQSLSGVDFALPEYDDSDFSADMEPPPDRHSMSADGERHAEEISKILAETDVYVKYGLHQKAVDHLRRVFLLDHENVEAHERLKDIFVSQGREQEAEVELLKLAETVASSDPDRAEAYLQELLAMNGTHTGAFELARRFRLRVARMSSVSAEVEYQGGGVAAVDVELDELDLSSGPMAAAGPAMGVARGHRRDSVDDFDPDELIGNGMAHGSPAPSRPPSRPKPHETENFELDFGPSPSQATRQMSPEHVDALANMLEDDDQHNANSTWNGSLEDAVDAHLDDDAIGVEIDNEVGAELHAGEEDLPFDPAAARAFDDAVAKGSYVSGYDETELPMQHAPDTSGFEHAPSSGNYDPYGTEAVQTPPTFDPTSSHTLDQSQL